MRSPVVMQPARESPGATRGTDAQHRRPRHRDRVAPGASHSQQPRLVLHTVGPAWRPRAAADRTAAVVPVAVSVSSAHQLGPLAHQERERPQRRGHELVIGIQEAHELRGGEGQARVARVRAGELLVQAMHRDPGGQLRRRDCRRIVDHEHIGHVAVVGEARHAARQVAHILAPADDDGDTGHSARTPDGSVSPRSAAETTGGTVRRCAGRRQPGARRRDRRARALPPGSRDPR